MKKYKLYDVVVAKRKLKDVPKGSKGTILFITSGNEEFVIEFVDAKDTTLNILTVNKKDIDFFSDGFLDP